MPWINQDGEKKYKPSRYCKEELPTWSEIYNEFYIKGMNTYDPDDSSHMKFDPYWGIPRRRVLLGAICNQFNKMIFEDGLKGSLIQFINEKVMKNCLDVRFVCNLFLTKRNPLRPWRVDMNGTGYDITYNDTFQNQSIPGIYEPDIKFMNVGCDNPPPIYTISTGKPNPFILPSSTPRADLTQLTMKLNIIPILLFKGSHARQCIMYIPDMRGNDYHKIIEFMIGPMKEYFEGEGVGWKDENGRLIESDPSGRLCKGVGYDPAL